ncbi:hypothetical protein ACHAXR_006665 [Thalassiosira sp. AJA248-18]
MNFIAASAKRSAYLAKGRSICFASRAPTSSFTATQSWKQNKSASVATSPFSLQYPPATSVIESSALFMVNRSNKSANRSQIRSSSSTAVASTASETATTSQSNSNNQKEKSKPKAKQQQQQRNKKKSNTGRLRLLPPLQPSTETLSRAQRQTHNEVKDDTKIANQRRRTQKKGAQTIDSLSQKLCAPLKATVQTYKWELRNMHPFEKVVMELTIQARQKKDGLTLSTTLDEIHEGRKELLQMSKDWISKIKTSPTAREAYEYTEEAKVLMGKVFLDLIEEPWGGVMELQKSLRNVPIVRLDCPAVVLVGAPNVGKSSIVRAISSGTPEVNNYPFTTRGMTLGHVQVFWESDQDVALGNVAGVSVPSERELSHERLLRRGIKSKRVKEKEALMEYSRGNNAGESEEKSVEGLNNAAATTDADSSGDGKSPQSQSKATESPTSSRKIFPISQLCQIMDSPGLLRRDDTEIRNEMEELTLAAMSHLPTAVMYVLDLSGGAGDKCSSVEDQLILRRELRARFPRRPWIDVISKVDLGIVDGARERLAQILEEEQQQRGGGGETTDHFFIELSIKEGQGVDELRQEVMRMLGEVRVVLDAMAAMDERSARAV